ncbi:MAG: acyl-CoA dehydrogenase family protein [Microthrixaceae bacterium]|nr:acyl-CoA dehydrogenase family protein [Microthrixaceae bacterium]
MAPWSIGGRYDRPIPRRIVEEAGVERRLFGHHKFSGGALVGSTQQRILSDDRDQLLRDLEVFMTHDGAHSYSDFIENVGHRGGSKQRLLRRANWLYGKLDALNYRAGRRLTSVGIRSLVPPRVMAVIASRASAYLDDCVATAKHLRGELDIGGAAKAKLWLTEQQCEVADRCLQLFGGYGYMREYPISQLFVDSRVQKIYGGANEIMKEIISRSL